MTALSNMTPRCSGNGTGRLDGRRTWWSRPTTGNRPPTDGHGGLADEPRVDLLHLRGFGPGTGGQVHRIHQKFSGPKVTMPSPSGDLRLPDQPGGSGTA